MRKQSQRSEQTKPTGENPDKTIFQDEQRTQGQ
jgi:hypothetical protein